MNVTTSAFSPTQMILAWTLLVLLLTWLITFSVLALRVYANRKAEWEDLPMPTVPYPAISTHSIQSTQTHLQYVRVDAGRTLAEGTTTESPRDIDTASIM